MDLATSFSRPFRKFWLCTISLTLLVATTNGSSSIPVVIGVDGGTESIRACCFDARSGQVLGDACAVPYHTTHPQPGWAEQNPEDWYQCLGQAVRKAVQSVPTADINIMAMAVDTTCCSVVALDEDYQPLRPCLLWMDQRSGPQTREIMKRCQGDPALQVNCGGQGPISAEWMTPKALWISENEPEVWAKAKTICEYQDFINHRLTGVMCASSCNAASRWHWDGEECIRKAETDSDLLPGRPHSLYEKLGIPELASKLPRICLPMGATVGSLTKEAANHLGLSGIKDIPVIQGGADAFVAMIGLGCINPGQLCLITGSSHLHCVVSSKPSTHSSSWGAYRGAPLPGINFAEGGQSSTGSILRWARKLFGDDASYKTLDNEAAQLPPGADGLVALETFQGSRTPITDPLARGALVGLTLSHGRAHIWRAIMEAVCFGTRACVKGLTEAGHKCDEIILAGGITRSDFWLQMHADVTGKPIVVCENPEAPLLGCAVLASVGVGVHKSVDDAVKHMVRAVKRIEPDPSTSSIYKNLYDNIYSKLFDSVQPVIHSSQATTKKFKSPEYMSTRGGATMDSSRSTPKHKSASGKWVEVSPSLLASDWSDMVTEVRRCIKAGVPRLHVDVFDGVFLDSPKALTFGPQMVEAIRRSGGSNAFLDLHMCVVRPARYVRTMAEAGADRFIFQWEAMESAEAAIDLAVQVTMSGMKCGVSINPGTDVEAIFPLLSSNLVDLVDVLAVEPGFGGQVFQRRVLEKISELRTWRDSGDGKGLEFDILVDGGINEETTSMTIAAGADILVSGSYLFQHPDGIEKAVRTMLGNPQP